MEAGVEAWSLAGVDTQWRDDLGHAVWPEPDFPPVGVGVVAGFDGAVVMRAEQDEVRQRCRAPESPGNDVVGFAVPGRCGTAGEHTATIT